METIYYIYHIPNYVQRDGSIGKIGVSEDATKRVLDQGYSEFEIIETHTDIMEVSKREIELQKQYGYKVDITPYYIVRQRSINGGHALSKEQLSAMGKLSKPTSEQMYKINKQKRKLTFEIAEYIRTQYKSGKYSQQRIADCFGVNKKVITLILHNKTYTQP